MLGGQGPRSQESPKGLNRAEVFITNGGELNDMMGFAILHGFSPFQD